MRTDWRARWLEHTHTHTHTHIYIYIKVNHTQYRLLDFLTSALYGGRLSASRPGRLYPQGHPWYSGPWFSRKEKCLWKIQWHDRESIPGPSDSERSAYGLLLLFILPPEPLYKSTSSYRQSVFGSWIQSRLFWATASQLSWNVRVKCNMNTTHDNR
jgi:hypothetical protein